MGEVHSFNSTILFLLNCINLPSHVLDTQEKVFSLKVNTCSLMTSLVGRVLPNVMTCNPVKTIQGTVTAFLKLDPVPVNYIRYVWFIMGAARHNRIF